MAARKKPAPRAAALPARRGGVSLRHLAPSGRSLLLGFTLVLIAVGGYAAARETSLFAVRHLVLVGGSPRARAEVQAALAGEVGRSLLKVDAGDVDARIADAPDVVSVSFDRSFPHTLRVVIHSERAVLLLRRGKEAWVVSARGRVMGEVRRPELSSLPRTWIARDTHVRLGDPLVPEAGGRAAAALAAVRAPLFGRIRFVRVGPRELTFVLHSGLELRLGSIDELRLKLAIIRRILPLLDPSADGYVDVSVPERPVVGSANSQVAG